MSLWTRKTNDELQYRYMLEPARNYIKGMSSLPKIAKNLYEFTDCC
jgi:hypothetical protein